MRNELLEGHSRLSNWLGSVVCLSPLSFLFWQTRDVTEPFCFLLLFFLPSLSQKRSACVAGIPPFYAEGRFFSLPSCSFGQRKKERKRERQRLPSRWRKPSGFLHLPISHALIFSCVLQLFCFVKRFSSFARRHFFFFFTLATVFASLEFFGTRVVIYFWFNNVSWIATLFLVQWPFFFFVFVRGFWLVSFRLVCPNRNRDRALHYCPSVTHIKHIIWSLTAFLKNKFSIRFLMIDLSQKICFFSSIILLFFFIIISRSSFLCEIS